MPRSKPQRVTLFDYVEPAAPVKQSRKAASKIAVGDVEAAKTAYLASYEHVGCGGNPVAWVRAHLGCSRCKTTFEVGGSEPLGVQLKRLGESWKKRK